MSIQQETVLEMVIHDLGYESVSNYALQKVREELQTQLQDYRRLAIVFEKKYQMNFQTFDKTFHELTSWSLFEREDDCMEWRSYQTVIDHLENQLKILV